LGEPVSRGYRDIKINRQDAATLARLAVALNLLLALALVNAAKSDFQMFYSAAAALRSGHASGLYDGLFLSQSPLSKAYTHPPYELLVFLPLSFLPYQAASYCWFAITLLLAALCGRLMGSYVAIIGIFPFLSLMAERQDSMLMLLPVIGCWLLLRRGRDSVAGFVLGLALFKFQMVLPLAAALAFWRPRLLRGLAVCGAAVFALSVALVKPAGMAAYWRYLAAMTVSSSSSVSQRYLMDPRANVALRGLVYELASGGSESVSPTMARLSLIALAALGSLVLWLAWRFMRSGAGPETKFAFAVLAAVLLSFHLLPHDLVALSVPLVLLAGWRARWPLYLLYVTPLLFLLYPHSQAWLALLSLVSLVQLSAQAGSQGESRGADPASRP